MKMGYLTVAAACALAMAATPALSERGGKPDKQHGASSSHRDGESGKSDKARKNSSDDERHERKSDRDDDKSGNSRDCGLGRRDRDDGPPGARSPDVERGDDCPAMDDHGKSDDDHGKADEDHGRSGDAIDADDDERGGGHADDDSDDEAAAPASEKKDRRWRWPWQSKDE